uniref:Ubiquitin-associated domain-containing protein 2 isoform X3 n=1 Tax=Geotrypetes seraphini TaxID=260995 RepID=A0A6P8R500_GEOSA|nr:ubiquitin-associated domain-containing protein 2 isoform X3 [Geotrypetes seraphini]
MFTSTGSSGLYKAPVSKSLLLIPSVLSILLTLVFQHHQKFFAYNLQAIREEFQIWRLICGRIVCLDLKDMFCSSLLIYNFRIFERRYGSRKFTSFILGSWVLSAVFDLLIVEALQHVFGITVKRLPSGFLPGRSCPKLGPPVCFICTILLFHSTSTSDSRIRPASYYKQDLGLYCGSADFNLQLLHVDFRIKWIEPTSEAREGMGATIDLQRQQRMELIDQQIMLSQFDQMRQQRQQQGRVINWSRFFARLRPRRNMDLPNNHQAEQVTPSAEASEEQVTRLMEMGFSRVAVLEALRASNNDINVATNFLLQH